MGTFYVEAVLPDKSKVRALVDTGATFSKFPEPILKRLGIRMTFSTKVELGDGRIISRKAGYVAVRLDGHEAPVPVMFGKAGEIPLIGATTLEILGLSPDPVRRRLIESPHLEIQILQEYRPRRRESNLV